MRKLGPRVYLRSGCSRVNGLFLISTVLCGLCFFGGTVIADALQTRLPPSRGLVLWLDASDLDGDGSQSNEPGAGTQIAIWKDRSGQENHVSQSAASHQPTVQSPGIGGRPVVRYDGNDALDRPLLSGFEPGDQPFHVVLVMKASMGPHAYSRLIDLQAAGGRYTETSTTQRNGFWIGYQGNGHNRLGIYSGDEGEAHTVAWDNQPHLVAAVYAGAQNWAHFLDGREDGSGTFSKKGFQGFAGGAKLAIGQHYGSEGTNTFYQGDLAEVLVYQRVLSRNEQAVLGLYLEQKYRIGTAYAPPPQFEEEILPLLAGNCHSCHGQETREADLDLRTLTAILRGGKNGPAIVRGQPERSKLLYLVNSGKMPPAEDEKLSPDKVALIRRWIRAGAPSREPIGDVRPRELVSEEDRAFWAFRKIRAVAPPHVQHSERVRTPVDRFVLARLKAHGLTLSPAADRVALIRRAYFDLAGLPPTPRDVAEFLADHSPLAYEQLIDRLLDAPQFGERWGRHWLDEAGYSDTFGADIDAPGLFLGKGDKWRYRDYVIRSFNEDKTFDLFITEQLAGDELVDWRNSEQWTPEIREKLIATGFLRCAADDTDQDVLNTPDLQYDVLQRTGEILGSNLLALTMECGKCHSHKYEPVPHRDYYRLMSFFQPAYNPNSWLQPEKRALPGLAEADRTSIEQQTGDLTTRLEQLRAPYRQRLSEEKYTTLPEPIRADTKTALETADEKRNEVQKYLAEKLGEFLAVTPQEFQAAMDDKTRSVDVELSELLAGLQKRRESAGFIQAIYEVGPTPRTRLLHRGDESLPQEAITPGFITVLCDSEQDALLGEIQPRYGSSGRRLALAGWLTDWNGRCGALVARVRVNRIWQRLFGEGIVPTAGNLGKSGQPPTHPELIEWLAGEYIRNQRRYKPLIKLLMTSTVYRQSSSSRPHGYRPAGTQATSENPGHQRGIDPLEVDPDNQLLWRVRLRRLESEVVRDTILAVSGQLDHTMGGPPVMLKNHPDGHVTLATEGLPGRSGKERRSVYLLARRNYNLSMLATFDQPIMGMNCVERTYSAVVSQSLAMLNDDFVIEHAEHLSARVRQDPSLKSTEDWIRRAFQIVLARPPTDVELAWGLDLLEHHGQYYQSTENPPDDVPQQVLAEFCQMLFNTNEFLYIQ